MGKSRRKLRHEGIQSFTLREKTPSVLKKGREKTPSALKKGLF